MSLHFANISHTKLEAFTTELFVCFQPQICQLAVKEPKKQKSPTKHALLATVSFIHHILSRSDDSKMVIRIFLLDFAKAFDHIDDKILLRKLSSVEAPPIIRKWISNFLTEREQRVKIGPYVSEWQRINGGVPQATMLGQILFLVMVNDLLEEWQDGSTIECIEPNCPSHLQDVVNDVFNY